MDNYSVFLNEQNNVKFLIHPIVVLSVLNHFQRRDANAHEAIGFIFGKKRKNENTIEICNALPLIFSLQNEGGVSQEQSDENKENEGNDDDKVLEFNQQFALLSLQLHNQSEPDEKLMGWYHTKPYLDEDSQAFHDLFLKNPDFQKYMIPSHMKDFICLLVDTELTNDRLNIRGYRAEGIMSPISIKKYNEKLIKYNAYIEKKQQQKQNNENNNNNNNNNSDQNKDKNQKSQNTNNEEEIEEVEEPEQPDCVFTRFTEIPISFHAYESEQIALDTMIKCEPDDEALDAPASLMTDMNNLVVTLAELVKKLETVQLYVHDVLNENTVGDNNIGWMISECLQSVPLISPDRFEEMLSSRLQDLLMLVYLSKLTHANVVAADKINQVLYKTLPQTQSYLNYIIGAPTFP